MRFDFHSIFLHGTAAGLRLPSNRLTESNPLGVHPLAAHALPTLEPKEYLYGKEAYGVHYRAKFSMRLNPSSIKPHKHLMSIRMSQCNSFTPTKSARKAAFQLAVH